MPYTAATALAFAQRQAGRYGDGECWTLVEAAIVGAGGVGARFMRIRAAADWPRARR